MPEDKTKKQDAPVEEEQTNEFMFDPFGSPNDSLYSDNDIEKVKAEKETPPEKKEEGEEEKKEDSSDEETPPEKKEEGEEMEEEKTEGEEGEENKEEEKGEEVTEDENEGVEDLSDFEKKKEELKKKNQKDKDEKKKKVEEAKGKRTVGDMAGELSDADIDNMSSEELDDYLNNVLSSAQEAGDDLKDASKTMLTDESVKKSAAYKELLDQLNEAKGGMETFENDLKEARSIIEKRSARTTELSQRVEDLEADLSIVNPYVEAIKSDDNLKDAIMFLARANNSKDDARKGDYEKRAKDAMYSYLEKVTGVDIRDIVDNNSKMNKQSVPKKGKGGGVGAGNDDGSLGTDPISRGIAMAF